MKEILNDEKFRKLLRKKQKYEMFSWTIPLISILSLIIILFLTSKTELTEFTIIILVLLIILIVGGYIFDNKITIMIQKSYANLNEYFQNEIVPKLIISDNPNIQFSDEILNPEVIDKIRIFNNYMEYKSQYHYKVILDEKEFCFNEVIFCDKVNFDTTGKKEYNESIKSSLNYHWYNITLDKNYPKEALYLIAKFENYDDSLIKDLNPFVLLKRKIKTADKAKIELYLENPEENEQFLTPDIIEILNDEVVVCSNSFVIHVEGNQLTIIIEEFDDLINLTYSSKIVVEKLLEGYYKEQQTIRRIVEAFNK